MKTPRRAMWMMHPPSSRGRRRRNVLRDLDHNDHTGRPTRPERIPHAGAHAATVDGRDGDARAARRAHRRKGARGPFPRRAASFRAPGCPPRKTHPRSLTASPIAHRTPDRSPSARSLTPTPLLPPRAPPLPPTQIAATFASCALDTGAFVTLHDLGRYRESGLDLHDLRDCDSRDDAPAARGVAHVFVVETAEHENPADEAVTFIRDALAARKKNRETDAEWRFRYVPRGAVDSTSPSAAPAPAYAVVAVGDADVVAERSAFRSKQTPASDCNQAGQLADAAVAACGGRRLAPRLEIDFSRGEERADEDVEAWMKEKLAPAVVGAR